MRTIRSIDHARAHDGALLVIDIVGSTAHLRQLGDWAYLRVIEAFERLIEAVELRHGSVGSDHTGDGYIVVFPGVGEALEAAEDVFARAARLEAGGDPHPLLLRAGLHKGEIILRERRLVGLVVYEAYELGNGAGIDELWLSAAARPDVRIPGLPAAEMRELPRSGRAEVTVLRPGRWGRRGLSLAETKAAHGLGSASSSSRP
ncbi:MAG: hypothetical protein GY929_27335 [Actinomycetia bacterium]|nr:hypothetical protein [Actinomycetes bacterium]